MTTDTLTLAAVGDVALLHRPGADLCRDGWDTADLRIANLEAPLTDGRDGVPAAKLIRLKSPPDAAGWLRDDLRCDAVSLANNHIMDWGASGLRSTLEALDAAGIQHAGAGSDATAAAEHRVLEVGDWRVAFLSWACTVPPGFRATAEQPGLAGVRIRTSYAADPMLIDEQPGTPPWVHTEVWTEDVVALEQALACARSDADVVVLALHWGVPPQWASPFQGPLAEYQEALAPRLVAAGADLVLGHHAHTVYGVQAFERPGADGGPQRQSNPVTGSGKAGRRSGRGLVCFSLGNYVFHPLAARDTRTIPLEAPSRPYRAPERPENRESFVGTFTFDRGGIREAHLRPAILDDRWEARTAAGEPAARIAGRLAAFSESRQTPVTHTADDIVLWNADG